MKDEISQLVDTRGRRPASNDDAIKLYNFSASLPLFRRKYDWKGPKWEPNHIRRLHTAVRNQLAVDIAGGPCGLDNRLESAERAKVAQLIKVVSARMLYETYLDLGTSRMADVLVSLVRRKDFQSVVDSVANDTKAFQRIFSMTIGTLDSEQALPSLDMPQVSKEDLDLASLWSRVADDVNANIKSAKCKLATECCTIFLNSMQDGTIIDTVSPEEIDKVRHYLATLPSNGDYLQRGAEVARELGLTLYQLLKANSSQESVTNKRWDQRDDERLLQLVQRQVNANARGHKRSASLCWKRVARQMGNKTNEQCRLRWRAIGKNTSDETFDDAQLYMLQILYAAYGDNWHKIAKLIPGRLAHQCRSKFLSSFSQPDRAEYVKYYNDLKNAITNGNAAINVRKWWARVDWLGIKLLKIANITKNSSILRALDEFYTSEEIPRRINLLFGSESLKHPEVLNGYDVLTLAEYFREYSSQMVRKILNSTVTTLLRKSKVTDAKDFENIFTIEAVDDEHLLQSLKRLLKCAWP